MEQVTKKLTPEELSRLQGYEEQINKNIYELGQVEIDLYNVKEQLSSIEKRKSEIMAILRTLNEKETELLKEFTQKYGTGSIDVNTGEISQ